MTLGELIDIRADDVIRLDGLDAELIVGGVHAGTEANNHSAAGIVTGGPCARVMGLEAAYATAAGYPSGDWTAYPVTGDFGQWTEVGQQVPTVEIELPDHESKDLEANLAGLGATLRKLTAGSH